LKLSPPKSIVNELKRDFGLMKDMFFGPILIGADLPNGPFLVGA